MTDSHTDDDPRPKPLLLCPTCKLPVAEHHKDDVQTVWYICEKGHLTATPIQQSPKTKQQTDSPATQEGDDKPVVLQHINDIEHPDLICKPTTIQAVISSTSTAYSVPSQIRADIREEGEDAYTVAPLIKLEDPLNVGLVSVSEETKMGRLNKHLRGLYPQAKVFVRSSLKHRTVYALRVRPPVFTLEKIGQKVVDDMGYEYKHLDLYVASDVPLSFQPSALVKLTGIPIPNPKTQKTTMLAFGVEFPEDNLSFDIGKLSELQAKFEGKSVLERLKWTVDNFELYSHVVGRGNIAIAALLGYFSPQHVRVNGELQRGWSIITVVGDTTTGKSETVKKLSSLIKAGLVISAETASTVGLTGTATQLEREGWFIDWGFLPLMDRKLLAIDGAHKLSASCWAALAEAERSGVLSIAKAAKNTTYARTRQIKIYNPVDRDADRYSTKSLGSFLHPVQALTSILDPTSIARVDLCVFSDQRDVTPEIINRKITGHPDPLLENLSEVLKWLWSGKATVEWTEEAVTSLLQYSTELYNKFFLEAIPLVSIDVKYKIARLSVALAYCTLSTNLNYTTVTITEEHVRAVVDFLTEEYTNAGLGILAQEHKFEKLTVEDVENLLSKVRGQLARNPIENLTDILCFIVSQNHTTSDELKAKFGLTENNQVRPLIATLKTEGLLNVKRGYYPTSKLIEAFKVSEAFTRTALNGINGVNGDKNEPPPPNMPNKTQESANKATESLDKMPERADKILESKDMAPDTKDKTSQPDSSDKLEGEGFNSEAVKPVKPVKTQQQRLPAPSRFCGDCQRFHRPDCQHPTTAMGGDPELIKPDNSWACECNGWSSPN
jgi:hypothetical protein